jgi:hypothetical protein
MGSKWDRLLTPIKEPFTNTIPDQQIQLALSLFKLVRKKTLSNKNISSELYRFYVL